MDRKLLLGAAVGSFIVAAFHLVLATSPALSAAFGAPKELLAAGRLALGVSAAAMALLFSVWGAYALAGAGRFRRLPLLRPGLLAIGAVYTLRGCLLFVQVAVALGAEGLIAPTDPLALGSSAVSLTIGLLYLGGTITGWSKMKAASPSSRRTGGDGGGSSAVTRSA